MNDLANRIASLQNVGWLGQALEDGPRHLCAGDSLQQFVGDVGRGEVGADEDIGRPLEAHEWEILLNLRNQRGISLHRPIDHECRIQFTSHRDRFLDAVGSQFARGTEIGE